MVKQVRKSKLQSNKNKLKRATHTDEDKHVAANPFKKKF